MAGWQASLSDSETVFIADTKNNRIRGVSAVCSQVCENGGRCVSHDRCECKEGWGGYDCTLPLCGPEKASGGASHKWCMENHDPGQASQSINQSISESAIQFVGCASLLSLVRPALSSL